METMNCARVFFALGCASALVAIGTGAFGVHFLRRTVAESALEVWRTAANYQMIHGIGLILVALASDRIAKGAVCLAGGLFVFGTIVFSGSLYALSALGLRWLGAITPIGGLALMMGWGILATAGLQSRVEQ